MEELHNIDIVINITEIMKIIIEPQKCFINAQTSNNEILIIVFDNVWDCRYTIENGFLERGSRIIHKEKTKNSIYEIRNSLYSDYFKKQISGTRPMCNLHDYIVFDQIDTVFEILSNEPPRVIRTMSGVD